MAEQLSMRPRKTDEPLELYESYQEDFVRDNDDVFLCVAQTAYEMSRKVQDAEWRVSW